MLPSPLTFHSSYVPLPHTLSCLTSKSGLQLNSGPAEVDENRALLEPRFNSNGFLTLVLVWLPSCYCCFIHKANGLTLHLKVCQRAIVNYWYQLHVNSRRAWETSQCKPSRGWKLSETKTFKNNCAVLGHPNCSEKSGLFLLLFLLPDAA